MNCFSKMASEAVQCWDLACSCISGYPPKERLKYGGGTIYSYYGSLLIICIFKNLICHFVSDIHSRNFFLQFLINNCAVGKCETKFPVHSETVGVTNLPI